MSDIKENFDACKQILTEIDNIYYYIGDDPSFEGLPAEHCDKILNLLLGVRYLYELKFNKLEKSIDK